MLLVPLCLLLTGLNIVARNLPEVVGSALPETAGAVGMVGLALTVQYLTLSVARQVYAAAATPF